MEVKSKKEVNEEAQAKLDIWKYVFGFTPMAVVKCAIELQIPDVLETHGGAMTLAELSATLGCSPSVLHRIMRYLMHHGFFKQRQTDQEFSKSYIQTPLSRMLMKNGENSMAAFVLLESSHVMLAPWHKLSSQALTNGSPAFEVAHGEDVWEYASTNLVHSKLINDAMSCHARLAMSAIVEYYPEAFKGVGSVVDVGGGDGTALRTLVKACPWIRGINFDLPHVVSVAPHSDGIQHVGGNMFENIPKADVAFLMVRVCLQCISVIDIKKKKKKHTRSSLLTVLFYLMFQFTSTNTLLFVVTKWVLHDWSDDECIDILRKCREAIPKDAGKVIIAEAMINEGEEDKYTDVRLALDMVMLAHTTKGKERTIQEWEYVVNVAGFTRYTVKHINAIICVIEAYP
ncbi:hypothetical protein DH2020_045305 [Rehmannia glutinosa]|uniref:Uncharacterized protein n=1 Tax=Rehmannia glutinosa TaxID=99300 RepID=A0ABR0UEI4_REHGL